MFDEAILIMDSRSESASARSQVVGFDWTRLYKSERYFLDLWLQHTSGGAVLMGQIIPEDPKQTATLVGSVAIKGQGHSLLNKEGGFRISLEPGLHDLHVDLCGEVIAVRGLQA